MEPVRNDMTADRRTAVELAKRLLVDSIWRTAKIEVDGVNGPNGRRETSTATTRDGMRWTATTRSEDCSAPARTAEHPKGTAYPPRSCT